MRAFKMDSHDADGSDTSRSTSTAKAKKPYTAPALVEWGTLRDLTQSAGTSGSADGGKGTRKKTH
jgi:hypothetical protein